MGLKITGYNNFFKIKGELNRNTLDVFQNEFRDIFKRLNSIIINIEDVELMDRYGVLALTELHEESLIKNKKLVIIGLGCKELYEHFEAETA